MPSGDFTLGEDAEGEIMGEARAAEQGIIAGGGAGSAQALTQRPVGTLGQIAWAVCDGSRSPYNVLVNIFVFAAYFTTVVIPDPVRGQTVWSYISAAGALLVAFGAPVLGAIADAGGRRKPWLLGCIVLGAPSMSLLWYATPGMQSGFLWIALAVIGGMLYFEYSQVFCNAMLPNIASGNRIGFLSGLGFSLANFFGIFVFIFYLIAWDRNPHPLFGLNVQAHEPERAVGMLAACVLVVLSIPLFVFTPDSPGTSRGAREAMREGLSSLARTLSRVTEYENVVKFLVARLLYNEGFVVMMLFTSVVAAGVLHWTPRMLIAMGLINSVVATLAALFAGWLDQRVGSKIASMLFVAGCLIANAIVCSITPDQIFFVTLPAAAPASGLFPTLPDKVFLVTQNFIAFAVTGGLVTSRTLMAKLAPRHMLNEFFGLYALSGNATSFLGPLAIGIVTALFASQRAGVAVGTCFFLAGLLLMTRVKDPGRADPGGSAPTLLED